jgi:hypothetical protein
MTSLIRTLLLLALLVTAAPVAPALAQDLEHTGAEHAAPAPIPGLAVARNEATVDFPEGITFTLDAETADPIANLELLYRPPGWETFSVELPSFQAGATELDLEHPIDLRVGALVPGIDVQYRWRITEVDGDVVETPERSQFWVDDRFQWTPLVGPNVTVYTYDVDPAFSQEILDTAERTIARLSEAYGAGLEQRVRVWAYSNREDYTGSLPPSFVQWTAGFNRPDLHVINLVLPPGDQEELKRVLPHEISHQILYQATKNPFNIGGLPAWLEEGMATYSQESGKDRLHAHALELASIDEVPSLRTLNGDFGIHGDAALTSYAFSLTVVMYILDSWGDEGISNLLATFDEGITYEDAVQQGLGISFDELDRRWQEDLLTDAQQIGAAGSTRFGDDGGASPWATIGEGLALASGTVIIGLVVLVAVVAGLFSAVRSRRRSDDDESTEEGVRWGEWPEGLEPPGWRADSPSRP